MRVIASVLFALVLGASLPAQSQNIAWLNDAVPLLGGGNCFPFGQEGLRYQVIVPAHLLPPGAGFIQDLFFVGTQRDIELVYGDLEFRMGLTPQAAPAADWKLNNPNPKVVFRGPLRVAFKMDRWYPVGLPAPYLYLPVPGQNLCVEVIVWKVLDKGGASGIQFYYNRTGTSASPGGPIPRAVLVDWVQNGGHQNPAAPSVYTDRGLKMGLLWNDGNIVILGAGCKGSSGKELALAGRAWPKRGVPFYLDLAGGAPSSAAILALGLSETAWAGIPLPFDLAPLGAPGCRLWHDFTVMAAALTDPSGAASQALPIPFDPALFGARLRASWLNLDSAANTLGLTTSAFARLIIGS